MEILENYNTGKFYEPVFLKMSGSSPVDDAKLIRLKSLVIVSLMEFLIESVAPLDVGLDC
jgi:hypothetical protein